MEDSIGTWVATTQLLIVAATAALIGLRLRHSSFGTGTRAYAWYAIASLFAYRSFDDGSMFHERIGTFFGYNAAVLPDPVVAEFFKRLLAAFPSYFWQIVFVPFFAVAGTLLLVFLARELTTTRGYAFVVAGLGLYVVAVALDFLEGAAAGIELLQDLVHLDAQTLRRGACAIEEYVEMLGTTLLLAAFLGHLAEVASGWRLEFVEAEHGSTVSSGLCGAGTARHRAAAGAAWVGTRIRSGLTPSSSGSIRCAEFRTALRRRCGSILR